MLAPVRSIALLPILSLCACGTPITCEAPSEAITGFSVTVYTGDDATDADIFFCVDRVSDATELCAQLGTPLVDNFDIGSIETFAVSLPVAAGDLAGVRIENRGDAPDLSLDGNGWVLARVRLVAQTAGGGMEVFDAPGIDAELNAGEAWEPNCTF